MTNIESISLSNALYFPLSNICMTCYLVVEDLLYLKTSPYCALMTVIWGQYLQLGYVSFIYDDDDMTLPQLAIWEDG